MSGLVVRSRCRSKKLKVQSICPHWLLSVATKGLKYKSADSIVKLIYTEAISDRILKPGYP